MDIGINPYKTLEKVASVPGLKQSDGDNVLDRFYGDTGRRLRLEALSTQRMVGGNRALAGELADLAKVKAVSLGQTLIAQGGTDNQVYFILSGRADVIINGRSVAVRGAGDHVGEMAAVEPTQKRSASVIALEDMVVAELTEEEFAQLANKHPEMYRYIACELSRRLLQRNVFVNPRREKIRVFLISSTEALPVARLVQNAFAQDKFLTTVWTDGVFRVAHYTLESIQAQIEDSDFAVAIAHTDDLTESRGKEWPSPRDNVIFELGLFMGYLGRSRAILMEPREEAVKLPSDLTGITTVPYRFEKGGVDAAALIAPACNLLRDHILKLGPNS